MDEVSQFFWAMVDATQAALIGLNLVPAIVLAVVLGLAAGGRYYWLKALGAVVLALPVAALWPQVYGMSPIWPDLTQIEAEIQVGVQFGLAWAIILALGAVKHIAAHATVRKPVKA
jgi:hypothetical protein